MKENVASMTLWSTMTEAHIPSSTGKAPYTITTRFWRNLEGKTGFLIDLETNYNPFEMSSYLEDLDRKWKAGHI